MYQAPLSCSLFSVYPIPSPDPWATALLFLGACLGHAVLMIASLNCLYGRPLPHKLLSVTRKLDALVVLAGPVLFWFAFGFHLEYGAGAENHHPLLYAYFLVCWVLGLGVFPALTLWRLLRRPPAALLKDESKTVDVAAELGYRPVGTGKYRRLAALPYNQVFQVDFSERTLLLPRLPAALDGLTVLHLSDLHLCGTPDREFYHVVLDRCRAWQPDLVALTGDVVDSDTHHQWVVPLLTRLSWRVAGLAILGNHDSWRDVSLIRRQLRKAGMTVLANTWEELTIRGERVVVLGHEGPWIGQPPDLKACPEGLFRLCLSHTPDNIKWARRHGIDLVLAGHVHGGQIRFPLVGSVFVPSRYSRRYDCGTFDEPPTLMHVSRGLGGQHPLRFNCRPEVTLLTLRSGAEGQV